MRLAICEDDPLQANIIQAHVQTWAQHNERTVVVSTFESAESFLLNWSSTNMYDLIFLDIKMKDMTGMELARIIRKIDKKVSLVFVTGDRESIILGYEVAALNYILKPITEEACSKCLTEAAALIKDNKKDHFVFSSEGRLLRVDFDDIVYFESLSHYISLHTLKEEFRFRKNMSDLENELSQKKCFIRTHRSFIVNLRYANAVEAKTIVLSNGQKLPVSRSYWSSVHKEYVSYYAGV